jgi:hypothetical protein
MQNQKRELTKRIQRWLNDVNFQNSVAPKPEPERDIIYYQTYKGMGFVDIDSVDEEHLLIQAQQLIGNYILKVRKFDRRDAPKYDIASAENYFMGLRGKYGAMVTELQYVVMDCKPKEYYKLMSDIKSYNEKTDTDKLDENIPDIPKLKTYACYFNTTQGNRYRFCMGDYESDYSD